MGCDESGNWSGCDEWEYAAELVDSAHRLRKRNPRARIRLKSLRESEHWKQALADAKEDLAISLRPTPFASWSLASRAGEQGEDETEAECPVARLAAGSPMENVGESV